MTTPVPVSLHRTIRTMDATAALALLPGDPWVFAATPTEFLVAQRTGGHLRTPDTPDGALPTNCFQLTAFTPEIELRWLAHPDGGRAVYLTENPAFLPGSPSADIETYAGSLEQTALCWGTPVPGEESNGFSALRAGRIGTAWYPVDPAPTAEQRVALRYREYVSRDQYGTHAVADTRLLELSATNAHVS